jgi:anthranilate phosphoribosyltransferase
MAMAEVWQSDTLRGLLAGRHLTFEQAKSLFDSIMDGQLGDAQIAAILIALAAKGEQVEEIAGAAEAMRSHAVKIDTGGLDVIDTCGTGGTGLKTFNISTTAAIVAAGAGARVAKHGNRTATRPSGSADVLAELGVNLEADPATLLRCLQQANVCFCFAVKHHPAMRYAAPVRKALGVRTVFNVLGPLTNPAGARRQLMGVFDAGLVEKIASVLLTLGSVRAMVVHAQDGLDEISTTSPTDVAEVRDGKVTMWRVEPEDFGLARATLADLAVTTVKESAQRARGVLAGHKGPDRDIVLLNASAALAVADKAADLEQGLQLAEKSIDSGSALATLEKLIALSHGKDI